MNYGFFQSFIPKNYQNMEETELRDVVTRTWKTLTCSNSVHMWCSMATPHINFETVIVVILRGIIIVVHVDVSVPKLQELYYVKWLKCRYERIIPRLSSTVHGMMYRRQLNLDKFVDAWFRGSVICLPRKRSRVLSSGKSSLRKGVNMPS